MGEVICPQCNILKKDGCLIRPVEQCQTLKNGGCIVRPVDHGDLDLVCCPGCARVLLCWELLYCSPGWLCRNCKRKRGAQLELFM